MMFTRLAEDNLLQSDPTFILVQS